MVFRRGFAAVPLLLALGCAHQPEQPSPAAAPAAKAADVASPDAILAAAYDVISGAAGKQRDWERFRSLLAPGARLIPSDRNPTGGGYSVHAYTPDEFVQLATAAFEKEGFYERGIASRMERYGSIAQVFSTYESRHSPSEAPFARGINSFQVFFDGKRWWIVTIFWQAETPDSPIPNEFLSSPH